MGFCTGAARRIKRGAAQEFCSGFGADIQEFGILVILFGMYKCQTCWCLALKGDVEGTHYETCHCHTSKDHHASLKRRHRDRHPETHEHLNGEMADT